MSECLYNKIGSLRFWNEEEIERRETFVQLMSSRVRRSLNKINPAFRIFRTEGPCLTPRNFINPEYKDEDLFTTNIQKANQPLILRGETTASTYQSIRASGEKLPVCFWQVGKSFRTEANDGASAAKLRFNEFWQLEFQVVYKLGTKADYRSVLMEELIDLLRCNTRTVESDRLPSYSKSTLDVEVLYNDKWKELASCSIRTDYSDDAEVCEIAIGLDRVIETGSF